jgi:hypothetical protein
MPRGARKVSSFGDGYEGIQFGKFRAIHYSTQKNNLFELYDIIIGPPSCYIVIPLFWICVHVCRSNLFRRAENQKARGEESAARTAASSLDLARQSFTLGNIGFIDVIDAQRRFAQAEIGLSRARAQRLMDTAQLYLALGGTPLAGAGAPPPYGPIRGLQ